MIKIRIVIISSLAITTPPTHYGGLEWVAYLRAKGLAELGQEVHLVAAKGSKAPEGVHLIEAGPVGGNEEEAFKVYKDHLGVLDVIIDDSWKKWTYTEKMKNEDLKVMGVVHSPCPYQTAPPVTFPCFVGVSEAHAKYLGSRLKIPVRHAYNGIDISMYPLKKEKGKRYLSLNRIMSEKGIHNFVDVVRRARSFGDVVGEDRYLIPDPMYVERVRTLCDGDHVKFWGRVSHERKLEFLQNAKATICLYNIPYLEVFGLMCVESLCVGTPVITLKGIGGPEEIVTDKTGFICSNADEIVEIIKADKVSELDPSACREQAEKFTYLDMAKRYLELAEDIVNKGNEW